MKKEEKVADKPETRWFIDQNWYQENNRSLTVLLKSYLCPKCAEHWNARKKEGSADKLLSTIKDCCSNVPDFITEQSPILESVFRLFLTNSNQPLVLEELGMQLSERRGRDTYRTSAEVLSRLLKNDQYYGLQEAKD